MWSVESLDPAREMISRSVHMVRHLRGRYILILLVSPLLSLLVSTPEKKNFRRNCHPICKKVRTRCGSPPHKLVLVGRRSPIMGLAQHLAALRALCTRRLPGPCNPDVFRSGIGGMRGFIVIRRRLCMKVVPLNMSGDSPSRKNVQRSKGGKTKRSTLTLVVFVSVKG